MLFTFFVTALGKSIAVASVATFCFGGGGGGWNNFQLNFFQINFLGLSWCLLLVCVLCVRKSNFAPKLLECSIYLLGIIAPEIIFFSDEIFGRFILLNIFIVFAYKLKS